MNTPELQQKLLALNTSDIKRIVELSGTSERPRISERTLWNVRSGQTVNASEAVRSQVAAALKGLKAARRGHK